MSDFGQIQPLDNGQKKGNPHVTPEPSTYGFILVGFCVLLLWIARVRGRR